MIRTYKYRIYPNAAQTRALNVALAIGRHMYNEALHIKISEWQRSRRGVHYYEIRKRFMEMRKEYPDEAGLLPSSTVDALMRRLDKSYKAFFKGGGFPKFKNYRTFGSLDYVYKGGGCKLKVYCDHSAKLELFKIGAIKVHFHRAIPIGTQIKMVVVKRDKQERWWASFQCEMDSRPLPTDMEENSVGIDIGMVYLLALSNGQTLENPHWYREKLNKRRVIQRKLDRQRRASNPGHYNEDGTVKPGKRIWRKSNRLRKTEQQLRKLEDKAAQQRWYFWHTITDELTRRFDFIALEDLTLDFMQQNKRLSMSAYDAAFGIFWQQLRYKAEERGCTLVWVKAAYTSQTCSECGYAHKDNRKAQSEFQCGECGHVENADINAAKVILQRGLAKHMQEQQKLQAG